MELVFFVEEIENFCDFEKDFHQNVKKSNYVSEIYYNK